MPNIRAANPEDYIRSDVRSVVRDALEAARHHQPAHCLLGKLRLFLDEFQQIQMRPSISCASQLGAQL